MSRARRRKPAAQPDARRTAASASAEAKARAFRLVLALAAATALVAAASVALLRRTPEATERIAFAPPTPVAADTIRPEDFAGADECAACHAPQHEASRASTHGRAGGAPSREILLRAFDGEPIRFRDAVVTPRVIDGAHAFVVRQEGREPITLRVEGVVGGGHMAGGGTQGFFTRWSDGTLRFLPFEVVRREGVWFCNTGTRLDGGWLPITADMRLADCGDWPPVRVQGEVERLGSCQQCHGSGIEVAPEPGRPAATRIRSWAVDCESCHGPARRHVALMTDSAGDDRTDIGLRSLATLGTDESLDVCFSCHALKDAVRPGYTSGASLDDYYSLALALIGDAPPVLADGRTRTFAYQQGHLWSDCYLNGAMTCTDCHDPHAQSYRDVNGNAIPGRFDDRQCTACHESKAADVAAHTKHAVGSEGSRCVSCHMPYLQERDVGDALRYARSDHTIAIPRPAEDAALGIDVACAQCHADVATDVLQTQVRRLWGEVKPRPAIVEGLLHATRGEDAPRLPAGADTTQHRMALFMALGDLFDRLGTDAGVDDATDTALRARAYDADPDVAAVALAALHLAAGDEPETRRFLAARIDSLGDSEHAVRARWAVLLGARGDAARARGDAAAAIVLYEKALEIRPDHAPTLLNLGLARAQAGDAAGAVAEYRRSIALDSTRALAHVNLGIALAASGDLAGAAAAYRAAMRADASEPLSYFNLGNLYLRAGRAAEAQDEYARAVADDASLAPAWFNLARARAASGDVEGAIQAVDRGLEFAPDDVAGNGMRRELVQLLGGRSGSSR